MNANFPAALAFVWGPGRDAPGAHTSPHDPGGATNGGVIQATWDGAVRSGIALGTLAAATHEQLADVLQATCWGATCDALPHGIDLLMFDGRMLSGRFPRLFQQCLGYMGDDVDGWIGPETLKRVRSRDPETLIDAVCGVHCAYLAGLPIWPTFGHGWTARLKAVQAAAICLADKAPIV